jgi:hypothetical protein
VLCRDLARQVLQWMPDPADAELAAGSCRLIRAFPIALMATTRNDHDLKRGKKASGIIPTPHICSVLCLRVLLMMLFHELERPLLYVCGQLLRAAGALAESGFWRLTYRPSCMLCT